MAKRIKRHDAWMRTWHWTNLISWAVLTITGLFLYVPAFGTSLGQDFLNTGKMFHRIFAILFIAVPLIIAVIKPRTFGDSFKNLFQKWDSDDKEFMKKFVPYLFAPHKYHMPKQYFVKSGQRISDLVLYFLMIVIAITGVMLWVNVPGVWFRLALLGHDLAFLGMSLIMVIHIYLGGGLFQPYRRSAGLMLGDGTVGESDALYHWGHWAEAELESGENVIEV